MAISERFVDSAAFFPVMEYAGGPSAIRPYNDICAAPIAKVLPGKHLEKQSLEIRFSEPDLVIRGSLVDVSDAHHRDAFKARAVIGDDVWLGLSAEGASLSVSVRPTKQSAHAEFVSSTITALLGLAERDTVTIALGDRLLRYDRSGLPLKTISQTLQWRDLAYKLLAIERAVRTKFRVPTSYSGEETQKVNFLFQAIIRRSFTWPVTRQPLPLRAVAEDLKKIKTRGPQPPMTILRGSASETLFGEEISLGDLAVFISHPLVLNRDELLTELAAGDGHKVVAWVGSLDGVAKINATKAPQLPLDAWSEDELALIKLDPYVTSRLSTRYNLLAAATLAGMSDEERAEITAQPELDGSSFMPRLAEERHS